MIYCQLLITHTSSAETIKRQLNKTSKKELHQSGQSVTVLTGVALEAVAQPSIVVTLSTAAALVAVEDSALVSGDIRIPLENALHSFKTKTSDSRGAARGAFIVLNYQPVLGTLNRLTIERDMDLDRLRDHFGGDFAVIDNLVRQVKKGQSDIIGEVSGKGTRIIEYNRESGESLIQSGNESQCEGFASEGAQDAILGLENKSLDMVLLLQEKVFTISQGIGSVRAESLGTINVSVLSITDAPTGLGLVPPVVGGTVRITAEVFLIPVRVHSHEIHVLDVLASTMSRALVGAGGAVASLALVALEALTQARAAVANTAAGALSVAVKLSSLVGRVNPSQLKRADAVRAISRLHGNAHTPVVIAVAHIVHCAQTMAAAAVVAISTDGGSKGHHSEYSFDHDGQIIAKALINFIAYQ